MGRRSKTRSVAYAAASLIAILVSAAFAYHRATRLSYAVPPAPNYADDAAWLCRPGRADACARPTTTTVIEPGGAKRIETQKPDPAAPIDCFYVYPTVVRTRTAYAAVALDEPETAVARRQLARFTSVCRPFAPLYRQVTERALPDLFGARNGVTIDVPYADVLAAWRAYLARDNGGRGVVLIGHSQGSRLLARLIAEEIDDKPLAARLVSAILPGTRVDVPAGKVVGGTYRQTPLCTAAAQTGCVIAYSSYPANVEMSDKIRFGITKTPGMRYACVDPAALDGVTHLDPALAVPPDLETSYGTDFVALPKALKAACKDDGHFSMLAIGMAQTGPEGTSAKAALDRLAQPDPTWGLHSFDINLALGTLVDLVRRQTASYLHR